MPATRESRRLVAQFACVSDVGRERPDNQDSWGKYPPNNSDLSLPGGHLFVVADGMGGHDRGRDASQLAVRTVRELFFADPEIPVAERLRLAYEAANLRVYETAQSLGGYEKMGTTCSTLALNGREALVGHVGDSRIYRIREGKLQKLTDDHTRVAELHRHGVLSAQEAANHPGRSVLTRAIGVGPSVEADVVEGLPVKPGDVYVLCTDGVARVSEDEIRETASSLPPQEACERLVALANERGGHDNVTVLIVRVAEHEDDSAVQPVRAPRERPAAAVTQPPPAPARKPLPGWTKWAVAALVLVAVGTISLALIGGGEEPPPAAAQRDPSSSDPRPAEPAGRPDDRVAALTAGEPADEAGDERRARLREAQTLVQTGRSDEALALFKEVVRDSPLSPEGLDANKGIQAIFDGYVREADQARQQADYVKAVALYKRAATIYPDRQELQQMIRFCEAKLGS